MLIADLISLEDIILIGLMLLSVAILMRRTARRSGRSRKRDVLSEVRAEMHSAEQAEVSHLNQLEVRLFDYEREVGARISTTLSVLDELVQEADHEIARLETLLDKKKEGRISAATDGRPDLVAPDASSESALDPEEREMIRHLTDAGFSVEEVAECVGCSETLVQAFLDESRRERGSDAA